jgi:hypothetical protein
VRKAARLTGGEAAAIEVFMAFDPPLGKRDPPVRRVMGLP